MLCEHGYFAEAVEFMFWDYFYSYDRSTRNSTNREDPKFFEVINFSHCIPLRFACTIQAKQLPKCQKEIQTAVKAS